MFGNEIDPQLTVSIVGTLIALILILLLWKQNRTLNKQVSYMISNSKVKMASDFINTFETLEFMNNVLDVIELKKYQIDQERKALSDKESVSIRSHEVAEALNLDEKYRKAVNSLFSFFNQLGSAYNKDLVDKDLINSRIWIASLNYYEMFNFFINDIRENKYGDFNLSQGNFSTDWETMNKEFKKIMEKSI